MLSEQFALSIVSQTLIVLKVRDEDVQIAGIDHSCVRTEEEEIVNAVTEDKAVSEIHMWKS
jgi:hypothetical protein